MPNFDAIVLASGAHVLANNDTGRLQLIPARRSWTVDKDGTVTVVKPTKSVAAEMRERFAS